MLSIQADELPPYPLKLWERGWRRWEFNILLYFGHLKFSASFTWMIFLPVKDERNDLLRYLVKLVKII